MPLTPTVNGPSVGVAVEGAGVGLVVTVGVGTGVSFAGADGDLDAEGDGFAVFAGFAVGADPPVGRGVAPGAVDACAEADPVDAESAGAAGESVALPVETVAEL